MVQLTNIRWQDPDIITDTGARRIDYQCALKFLPRALHFSRFSPKLSKTLSIRLWTRCFVNISNLRANSNVPWNWAVILSDVMSLSHIALLFCLLSLHDCVPNVWKGNLGNLTFRVLLFHNLLIWIDTNIIPQSTRVNRHEPGNGAGNHQRSR